MDRRNPCLGCSFSYSDRHGDSPFGNESTISVKLLDSVIPGISDIEVAESVAVEVEVGRDPGERRQAEDPAPGEEALEHLFEEFYRAPNARAAVKEGTGLGLVVAKDIVTRYGGSIQVQSQAGQGTTFTVTLPILAASPEGEAA